MLFLNRRFHAIYIIFGEFVSFVYNSLCLIYIFVLESMDEWIVVYISNTDKTQYVPINIGLEYIMFCVSSVKHGRDSNIHLLIESHCFISVIGPKAIWMTHLIHQTFWNDYKQYKWTNDWMLLLLYPWMFNVYPTKNIQSFRKRRLNWT